MELKLNKKAFEVFSEVTKELNKLGIVPILVGSLGLSRIIGEFKKAEDIDTGIPEDTYKAMKEQLMEVMGNLGFKFIEEKKQKHEYEFARDGEIISLGGDAEILKLAGAKAEEIKITEEDGIKFRELSPEQYLKFYESLSQYKERQKQGKNDQAKIDMIKDFLKKNKASQEQEYLEGWKRCQADFENYKKRQSENMAEMIKYSNQGMILEILPVLDNFHASTDHIPEDQKDNAWVVGIMHIQKQLEKVLTDNNVTEIETKIGDDFDPNIHEAIHSDKKQEANNQGHRISKVILKGYKIDSKVIRAARVIVE